MTTTRFLHTSDWQVGARLGQVDDPARRVELRRARVEGIAAVAEAARATEAAFVVVAGDLFDAPDVGRRHVIDVADALSSFPCPVYVLPGNHDFFAPGTVWADDAPHGVDLQGIPGLTILGDGRPVEAPGAVLLPGPLHGRNPSTDPLAWLTDPSRLRSLPAGLPRVVVAHGSVADFGAACAVRHLDLSRLPAGEVDYVALGDWHGTKDVSPRTGPTAWYSGTHEPDRFPPAEDYDPGNVLVVEAARNGPVRVVKRPVGRYRWLRWHAVLHGEPDVEALVAKVEAELRPRRSRTLLALDLEGRVGVGARARLLDLVEHRWREDFVYVRLSEEMLAIRPSVEDLALLESPDAPAVARVSATITAEDAPVPTLASLVGRTDPWIRVGTGKDDDAAALESEPKALRAEAVAILYEVVQRIRGAPTET